MTELLMSQQRGANSVARIDPAILARQNVYHRPNWRRDLNHVLFSNERSSVDSSRTFDHGVELVEHARRAVTLVPTTRKPFDVLAEGLVQPVTIRCLTPIFFSRASRSVS